jgi:hypothetical protein
MAAAERPFYLLHRALVAIRYSGSLAGAYAQTIPNDAARSRSVRRLKPKRNLSPDCAAGRVSVGDVVLSPRSVGLKGRTLGDPLMRYISPVGSVSH